MPVRPTTLCAGGTCTQGLCSSSKRTRATFPWVHPLLSPAIASKTRFKPAHRVTSSCQELRHQKCNPRTRAFNSHRMVWVGRDLKAHLAPTPCHGQGHPPPDQVAQIHIQPGLNTSRDGASTSSLGSLCLTTLMEKNFFLISNLNLPSQFTHPQDDAFHSSFG